jgi:murein DD-endopeptidase MepM/ murein hydrolase activator NlpD
VIKANSQLTKILSLIGITSTALYFNSENAQALPNFNLPYPNGSTYQVTQGWGGSVSHTDYYNKYAVDFGMSIGQPVAATAPGKVIRSSRGKSGIAGGCDRRYINSANYVVIDHGDNVSSLYLHLSEVNVSVGDTISQGQIIGKSGNTGYVCGPHLHFTFQKTNTVGTYAGESIGYGFIETGKNAPQSGVSYTSQNRTNYTSESSVLPEASATKNSSYQLTCSNISVEGDTLLADCRKRNQTIKRTSIRILGIENIDGDLKDNGTKNPSTYQNSCNNISVAGATLSANCRKINGSYKSTSILIPGIQNIDGTLSY